MRREVFVFNEPCDMRKSFDGLYGLIRDMNPLAGSIFLFVSKDRKRAKSLHWDGTGLVILMKRIEKGRFADIWSRKTMTERELSLFFAGSRAVKKTLVPPDITDQFDT
jgi:transposase